MLNWPHRSRADEYNVMGFFKIVGYKSIRELRINRSFNNVHYLLSIPLQIEELVDFGCFTLILFLWCKHCIRDKNYMVTWISLWNEI